MMIRAFASRCGLGAALILGALNWAGSPQPLVAADYFLTIGGGYDAEGNQASLEENVVFFQQVLSEKHPSPLRHDIFFADGHDPAVDLQILADKPAKSLTPATDLLAALHRQDEDLEVAYRNHRVTNISGPLDPELIRADLERLANTARAGDRLIVYVTAHGSEGPKGDLFNTTIDCWDERKISAREFTKWLDKVPPAVPVVMVMAQCYCGGFGHTIFQDLGKTKGLAPHLRAGFFAQQHNLPAAGCRPDIEHDEEFSSYFWGALAGRSRNGVPIQGVDVDGNGVISFAEAHAYAVVAGETVDIPLRTSEVFLRNFSRLTPPETPSTTSPAGATSESPSKADPNIVAPTRTAAVAGGPEFTTMTGTLQTLVDRGRPVSGRVVQQLSKTLEIQLQDEVKVLLTAYDEHRRTGRNQGRGGRRQGSARRDLLREITEKWPDLGDEETWEDSPLLKIDNQEQLLAELQKLPSWKSYDERVKQRAEAAKRAERHELRAVKFRRLINELESIVLEKNLPLVATPEIVARYQQMIALEESTLDPTVRAK